MTRDFRNIGRSSSSAKPASPPATKPQSRPNQRVVLLAIHFAAILFFAAGLWLLGGQPSPIPAETAPILGIAFIISAIADIVIAAMLKRIWGKQ